MATGCGCGQSCSCYMKDGVGIDVTGDGSFRKQWQPNLNIGTGDVSACVRVMNCVGSNLAEPGGLEYNPDTHNLAVDISADEGNSITFGTDGGLFSSGSGPTPQNCVKTVDGLPPKVVGGNAGAGPMTSVWGTVRAYERAVDLKLDMTQVKPFLLRDGTLGIAPFDNFTSGWTKDPVPSTALNSVQYNGLTNAAWRSITIDFENYWPGTGEVDGAEQGASTFSDVLRVCGGRLVLLIDVDEIGTPAASWKARMRALVVQSLTERCLAKSAIIYSSTLSELSEAQSAGIATGIFVTKDNMATNTPAAIQAAGAEWAVIQMGPLQDDNVLTVAEMAPYADAGLQVIAYQTSTRRGTNAAITAGARGFSSYDPVYVADDQDRYAPLRIDHWQFQGTMPGQQPWRSPNSGAFRGTNLRGQRAPGGNGWQIQRDSAYRYTSTLLGGFSPLQDPNNLWLTWNMQFTSTPATPGAWLGVAFSMMNDHPFYVEVGGEADNPNVIDGYLAMVNYAGQVQLHRFDNGIRTQLATQDTGVVPTVGTFYACAVRVRPDDTINYTCGLGNANLTVTDPTYRGEYIHIAKFNGTSGAFDGTFLAMRNRVNAS